MNGKPHNDPLAERPAEDDRRAEEDRSKMQSAPEIGPEPGWRILGPLIGFVALMFLGIALVA